MCSPAGAARELARLACAEAARGCGVACSPDAAACLSGLRPRLRLSIDLAPVYSRDTGRGNSREGGGGGIDLAPGAAAGVSSTD